MRPGAPRRVPRRPSALATLAALGALGAACSPVDRQATPPAPPEPSDAPSSVVLVVLDTARADFFSSYGFPDHETPEIDRVAADGQRFVRAYAPSFWTLPSHAALFTGLYPSAAGATSETNRLPADTETLAERLRSRGYRTISVASNPWISRERGFDAGFDEFVEAWRDHAADQSADEFGAGRAVEAIREHARGAVPYFLFLNLNAPHLPYQPPDADLEAIASRWPAARVVPMTRVYGAWRHLAGGLPLDDTDFAILRELYAGEIRSTDRRLGRVLGALRAAGTFDETLLVITSDHGENIGEHGMIDHLMSMYDTTVRVPLVLRGPRCARAVVRDDPVSLIDVLPTVLAAAGAPPEASPGGIDLCSAEAPADRALLAENDRPLNGLDALRTHFPDFDSSALDVRMRMVRLGPHKLIWHSDGRRLLFDVEADPAERHDLAAAQPALVERLMDRLREWTADVGRGPAAAPFESRDAESLERLRSLGYVE